MVVALPEALVLLGSAGELIERMGAESLPGRIERIGTHEGRLVAATPAGNRVADADLIAWQPTGAAPQWSAQQEPPAGLRERMLRGERGPGLSAERVLLDLHSGRIFGRWGPWLMDATAIVFVILAITGITCWWRSRRGRPPPYSWNGGDSRNRE